MPLKVFLGDNMFWMFSRLALAAVKINTAVQLAAGHGEVLPIAPVGSLELSHPS